ncbi:cytochrome c oxidase subunit 2 [Agrobacterium larrymoorei]|uniref:Cytochrome aa3 subunit 2 n=1 Tax=Agrobacterium larrymoorei TaxID=160699 RepID=A0AAJ2BJK4_9HYPH|nr:cytochrome c oxidase subunit II [Agrobacterium larrymoorei]MDR6100835.1 cytochrome c oxidase subunit 2 [Agrobacterium larrymoorei]
MLPLTLAGCSGDLSALDPAGPASHAVAQLWWIMLTGSLLLFALVLGLFFLSLFSRKLSHVPASRWIIGGGIVMPIPVLTVLLGAAFLQGEALFGARAGAPSDAIRVQASMWNWDIRYGPDDAAPASRNVLHIPAGQTVEIVVTSTDVIHSFWVPRLAGKIDAIPGHETRIRLKADRAGIFGGICAEYCGTGHSAMTFSVIAHEPDDYQQVIQTLPDAQGST